MTNETEPIMASPLPGEMEGNEPPAAPEADDQLPFADIDDQEVTDGNA